MKKIKILIVDDERLVRITMESMLNELYPAMLDISHANSAEKMEKFLKSTHCDIVFLDINMPQENGLEVLARLKMCYNDIVWCILTGYSYFHYVKKALELGVTEYLLKPPAPDELKRFVDQAIETSKKNRIQKHRMFEEMIRDVYIFDEYAGNIAEEKRYFLYVFFVDAASEQLVVDCYKRMYKKFEQFYMERNREFAAFFCQSGELCLLIDAQEDISLNPILNILLNSTERESYITGLFEHIYDIASIRKQIAYIVALSPLRLFMGANEIKSVTEWEADTEILHKRYYCECLERMTSCYFSSDTEGFNRAASLLIRKEQEITENRFYTAVLKEHMEKIYDKKIFASSTEELIKCLSIFNQKNYRAEKDVITVIKEFVNENYMYDVSTTKAAELCNITPTYLSRIFREKTGKKYIDYVTSVRMEKGFELLRLKKYSVKEVSNMTGYISEKYFSRTFKKIYGFSPSQVISDELKEL